jgi:excisionase family DNA binding protein
MARKGRASSPANSTDDTATSDRTRAPDPRAFGLMKAAYSVREAVQLLSVGRTSLYAAVRRGELRSIKLGRRTLFCAPDLAAFLTRLRASADQSARPES